MEIESNDHEKSETDRSELNDQKMIIETTEIPDNGNNESIKLRDLMLDHLANKTDVHFKSQQLGEPDLSFSEKRAIAENVLDQSHSTFLSRFGNNILMEHLPFFTTPDDDQSYEVQFYVNKLKNSRCKPASDVQIKNRRFEAMKRLMSEGEYFSVNEMRKRNPLLFDQLLGSFLADPEFKATDVNEHQIAHILLDQIEQDQVAALRKEQIENEIKQSEEYVDSSDEELTDLKPSTSKKNDLVLWGNIKSVPTIGKSRWKNKHSVKNPKTKCLISQEEKILLINEFTSSMFNSFLQGKDEFNYSEVDNNPEYDDVNQCDVDEQEKYFDSESPENVLIQKENEDDDLDAFMKVIQDEVTSENLTSSFKHMSAKNKSDNE